MPRISIAAKNAIVYFILLICTSTILGYSIYRISSNKILENATLSLNHNNESVVTQFNTFLEDIEHDILFLSKNPFLYQFLDQREDDALREKLSQELLALLSTKRHYFQLRLIGLSNQGKEIIRAEKFTDHTGLVEPGKLQIKGDRDYFRETIVLPEDSIYFSEINLNQEYGQIIFPAVPTMRVAKPIYHHGTIFGILIINVDLSYVFSELNKIAGPQNTLTLINNKGYYLIHPDSNAVFGFEFSKAPAVDLQKLEMQMKQQRDGSPDGSELLSEEALYSIQHYAYPRPGYSLYFSLSADKDILLSVFNQWKLNIILLTALFTFLSLAIAFWWVRRQTKEFKSITESIIRFGKNPERVKLNIDRDDEIGDLALSFQEMAHKIDLHLKESHDARVEAIEANTAKQQFLENMSHEIRNPLQSILGMTGMLIQNKPRADQQVFIDTLKFSSETLLALVNDILEYRKLIHGQIELRMQETELEEYVQNILKSHFYDAGQNKVRLKLELDPGLQQQVFLTDGLRLGQILHNLLSNAIRHAPPGSEVRLKVERPRAEELVFTVMDEGLGISPENIQNILQQKPVTGLSTNKQNVGLGLPIVIHLLRLFDSALQIESKTGSGSAFQFALKTRFKALAPRDQQPKENQAGFKAYIQSVALLEDDAQNVFFYQQLFDELGIATVAFDTPSKLKPLPNGSYDLFITDLNFPEGPVTRHIEQLKQFLKPEGLLFLVSASDDLDALLGSGRKDFDAILQKPVKSDDLKETISHQVFRKHYEWPLMEVLYSNYDHQSDKVLRALEITAGEWQDMSAKLLNAIDKTELHAFDQVYHKLINTMRTFGLQALQSELDQARKLLEEGRADLPNLRERIAFPLHHYLKLFLKEIEKLKAGMIPFPGQPG